MSDHSPSTVALKRAGDGDFGLAWGGVSGLQVGLSAVWTEARSRGIPFEVLVPLFTTGPARIAGLTDRGQITVGAPAHLTAFGLDDTHRIDARALQHRNPVSAYDGKMLTGRVRRTWLHGATVFDATEGGAGEAPGIAVHRAENSCTRAKEPQYDRDPAIGVGEIPGAHYVAASPTRFSGADCPARATPRC